MTDFLRGSAVPVAASGPTLDAQIERLAALGLPLHEDCDPELLVRAVARGVTPDDLGEGSLGARPIPPYRRACYWWLLCEDIGGVPALRHRFRIDLEEQVFAAGYLDGEHMPLVEQLRVFRTVVERLRRITGADSPHLVPIGEDGKRVSIDGVTLDWSRRPMRDRLRDVLSSRMPGHECLVMYQDLVGGAPDLGLVVAEAQVEPVTELISDVLPSALRAGEDWLQQVEQHSTSEQVGFCLDAFRMTSGLALSSEEIPPWPGVHPMMSLSEQLERLRGVGLAPRVDDISSQLPMRRPSRVPRMSDRPFHDLFDAPSETSHRGLLQGVVRLRTRVPARTGSGPIGASLTRSVRALAEAARPELAVPRVGVEHGGSGSLEATAMIDGHAVTAPVELVGGRCPVWDAEAFLSVVAEQLRLDAQCWVLVRPESSSRPCVCALVPVWQSDQVAEMGRIAFGDEGLHRAGALQEQYWHDWSDWVGAHDRMLSMDPTRRLATLERCGIGITDAEDREIAEEAAESASWIGLLNAARREQGSVFSHTCIWSTGEVADLTPERLPEAAAKMARAVGCSDLALHQTLEDGGVSRFALEVGGELVQLAGTVPRGEPLCPVIREIARRTAPSGREPVFIGDVILWPLASRAAELRMLLLGG